MSTEPSAPGPVPDLGQQRKRAKELLRAHAPATGPRSSAWPATCPEGRASRD